MKTIKVKTKKLKNGTIKHFYIDPYTRKQVLHRENGPALIEHNGVESYYIHGKLHRSRGPAVVSKCGKRKEYYIDGLRHRIGGPAKIWWDDREWYVNGVLHREDGPAIYSDDMEHYEYYINGELHREGGPAKYSYGDEYWYKNGELHRVDGPASIETCGDIEWYFEGELHRVDGPAVYHLPQSDEDFKTTFDDALTSIKKIIDQSLSKDKLAIKISKLVDCDGSIYNFNLESDYHIQKIVYYKHGELHREGGPAVINSNGSLRYYQNGELHRLDGPAKIDKHGNPEEEAWYKEGELHRLDGPAVKSKDGSREEWYKDGKLHRVDGPALINGDDREWYFEGKLHRLDGPAKYNINQEEERPELHSVVILYYKVLNVIKHDNDPVNINAALNKLQELTSKLETIAWEIENEEEVQKTKDTGFYRHGEMLTEAELVACQLGLDGLV